jgi:hypothetical protein
MITKGNKQKRQSPMTLPFRHPLDPYFGISKVSTTATHYCLLIARIVYPALSLRE